MKMLQLIDTLHPGGAERVALNYANALMKYGVQSHICATRDKGILVDEIQKGVVFHFLGKKDTLDLLALIKLRNIIRENKIDILHAHGTSWFFPVLCKISGVKFKLIWHDHYGNSEFLENRETRLLKFFSAKFDGIISVNNKLRVWAQDKLKCKKVLFLNNFIEYNRDVSKELVELKGNSRLKIVCVANLRPQKDHDTLLEAFKIIMVEKKDISLHLFGNQNEDQYSRNILAKIKALPSVFWYGEKRNIISYLKLADIGVLSSNSEGLPLALLEYARAGLGIVATEVGECREVIGSYGLIVSPHDPSALAKGILCYINDQKKLIEDSQNLQKRLKKLYSEEHVIPKYLNFCRAL